MYKDKEAQKEANRLANLRYRNKQKGITQQGITEGMTQGITGLVTDNLGYQYKVLTDGQHWYPGRHGYHPEGCTCGIEHKERPGC